MNVSLRGALLGTLLAAGAIPQSHAEEEDRPKPFSLDQAVALIGEEFVDPSKAELVEFQLTARGVWGAEEKVECSGWKKSGVLEFGDGVKVPEGWATDVKPAKFPAAIAALYQENPPGEEHDSFADMRVSAMGGGGNHLAHAAWLEKAGRHDEAARALAAANAQIRMSQSALEVWRNERAWFYYAGMVHAFMVCKDAEAELYGELLLQRFPDAKIELYPQAPAILADIRRRKEHPLTVIKVDDLPLDERIKRHIADMENIAEMQSGQPGGVDLAEAPCVKALITIGDPAVPALLDALELDTRLTRSVHFWRDFAPSRTVLSVKETALTALMSILRTEFFDAASTGDNFTHRDEENQTIIARGIRNYWEKFGKLPFDERMMTILTAKESSTEARREAARNLATLNDEVTLGTTVWTGSYQKAKGPNPVIAKFSNPTVAEATLQSLDREMEEIAKKEEAWRKAGKKQQNPDTRTEFRIGEETFYAPKDRRDAVEICAETLSMLDDPGIAPILARRSLASNDLLIRATWARTADLLGDPSAVASLKDALVADTLDVPARSDRKTFRVLFACLTTSKQPAAMEGLHAVLDAKHRWHRKAVDSVLHESDDSFDSDGSLISHPWCLELLGGLLDDPTETRDRQSLKQEEGEWRFVSKDKDGESSSKADPKFLDESVYNRSASVRVCDQATMLLLRLLGDHTEDEAFPLAKNRDSQIEGLKHFLKAHQGTFRNFAEDLDGGTSWAVSGGRFLPVLPPLDHAATAGDVAAGKALFFLENPERPPGIRTPLATEWYGAKPSGHAFSEDPNAVFGRQVVVLQVERDAHGALWFGAADGNGFFVIPSKEIGTLYPIGETTP